MPKMNLEFVVKPSFRDLAGRWAEADAALLKTKREEMRSLGRTAVSYLRREAPKKTGKFAAGIRFQTRESGDTIRLTTSAPQPLGKWIVGGTQPHEITPRGSGYPLRFQAADGSIVRTYRVRHPGTEPNPYPSRAWQQLRPTARAGLSHMASRYTAKLTG